MFQIEIKNKKFRFVIIITLCGLFLSACGKKSSSSNPSGVKPPNHLTESEPIDLNSISGDRQVKLSWEASSPVDGLEIIGYEYQKSEVVDGFDDTWIPIPGGESTRELIVSGLTDGNTYYFRVRAVNHEGTEMPSTEVSAMAYDGLTAEPSSSPSLTATPGDSQVTLSWSVPDTVGVSAITGYEYQQSLTSSDFDDDTWLVISVEEEAREVIILGLTNGTTYYFRVRAVNIEGRGSPSAEVSALPNVGQVSQAEAPPDLLATSEDRQVLLSWGELSASEWFWHNYGRVL